MSSQVQETRP